MDKSKKIWTNHRKNGGKLQNLNLYFQTWLILSYFIFKDKDSTLFPLLYHSKFYEREEGERREIKWFIFKAATKNEADMNLKS